MTSLVNFLFVVGSSELVHWTYCFRSWCWISCSQCWFLFLWFWFFLFRHFSLYKFLIVGAGNRYLDNFRAMDVSWWHFLLHMMPHGVPKWLTLVKMAKNDLKSEQIQQRGVLQKIPPHNFYIFQAELTDIVSFHVDRSVFVNFWCEWGGGAALATRVLVIEKRSLFPKFRIDFCSVFFFAVFCLKLANLALMLFLSIPLPVFVFISGFAMESKTDCEPEVELFAFELVGGVFWSSGSGDGGFFFANGFNVF